MTDARRPPTTSPDDHLEYVIHLLQTKLGARIVDVWTDAQGRGQQSPESPE
jgi:hypothetical protein